MTDLLLNHLASVVTVILTLVFVASILRAKRPAGTMLAWVLLILTFPYVGLPLYVMLGFRKFPSKLNRKIQLYTRRNFTTESPELVGIQRILSASGAPSAKSNRTIDLLTTGEEAFARYVERIYSAKKSVDVTTFILADDEVGRAIISALGEAAARGVRVRVIVDSLSAVLLRQPSLNAFKQAGGQVAYFMPLLHLPFRGRYNLRNHRKLLVIDGESAILGGMNLSKDYMGPDPDKRRWADIAVQVDGACVPDLQNVFERDWAFANSAPDSPWIDTEAKREVGVSYRAQVVASGPDVAGDPLYDVLLYSLYTALREIQIVTPYFVPDEALAKALELAAKRGVKVQILTPRRSNHFLADLARGSFVRQLAEAGVEFAFYRKMIHAKVVVIDHAFVLLGSANFDMRSLLLNYELGILIDDAKILRETEEWIAAHVARSTRGYPAESFWRQITEGIGRIIGPYI